MHTGLGKCAETPPSRNEQRSARTLRQPCIAENANRSLSFSPDPDCVAVTGSDPNALPILEVFGRESFWRARFPGAND